MSGYSTNIEVKTLEGNNFREVLYTTARSQLVIMTLQPGQEIGFERHDGHDQFIRVEDGEGVALLDGEQHALSDGIAVVTLDAPGRRNALTLPMVDEITAGLEQGEAVILPGTSPLRDGDRVEPRA